MGASGLGALLVKEGLLSHQDRMIIGKSTGQHSWAFAKGVLASGLLDETELASLLAERTAFTVAPHNFLDTAEADALAAIDVNLMQELEVYPLKLTGQTLTVAMVDPLDKSAWNQLTFFTGLKIKPVIAPLSQIRAGLKRLNPHFQADTSELESFFSTHAPAAFRQQTRHEKPVAAPRVSKAVDLLPEEPVIKKVTFPKLEDVTPEASAPAVSAPVAADVDLDLDLEAAGEVSLDDLPALDGDDTADLDFAEESVGGELDSVGSELDSVGDLDISPTEALEGGDDAVLSDLSAVQVNELVAEDAPLTSESAAMVPEIADDGIAEPSIDEEFDALLQEEDSQPFAEDPLTASEAEEEGAQVVFHPAMGDLNQALLYLSFCRSQEDAFRHAVKGWQSLLPCGVLYQWQGQQAFPRLIWENGNLRDVGLEAYGASSAQKVVSALSHDQWQDVAAAEPFSEWAKNGALIGGSVGAEMRLTIVAGAKTQAWQIEGFQQAAMTLFRALAEKTALLSLVREKRVAD